MRIRRSHQLGVDRAKDRVNHLAGELEKKFSLTSEWRGDDLRFRGTGVHGRILVADSSIEIIVRLGLGLMMMKHPIRAEIEQILDNELA
jgi:putative polyhydroxyalkanoate system protein